MPPLEVRSCSKYAAFLALIGQSQMGDRGGLVGRICVRISRIKPSPSAATSTSCCGMFFFGKGGGGGAAVSAEMGETNLAKWLLQIDFVNI